jgi:DNA-binding NtrC family response regulator
MTTVLLIEDDPKIRATVLFQLRKEGLAAEALDNAEGALGRLEAATAPLPDLLLLDVRLPGMTGVDLVERLAALGRLPPTIIISGEASITETVEALRLGVHDFIEKPFTKERLLRSIRNTLEQTALRQEVAALRAEISGAVQLLGESSVMQDLRSQIDQAAPTDARVLIRGESGTGKELVADALHRASRRRDRPFIKINCAAIPTQLIEDELFGHVRGAFTDAKSDKPGLFEEADGGTLFLDEIGDMEYELQSRLLRVLEDGKVRRIGSSRERAVDVRVIAATHSRLEDGIGSGQFREDLYFRLAHLPLEVPPLRDRDGDISLLFNHFLRYFVRRHRARPRRVDDRVLQRLEAYPWPGNVRELRSLCERLVVFAGDPITVGQLPRRYRGGQADDSERASRLLDPDRPLVPLRDLRRAVEREYIERALRATGGNVAAAARQLGLARTHLHQKIVALGVDRGGEDEPDSGQ